MPEVDNARKKQDLQKLQVSEGNVIVFACPKEAFTQSEVLACSTLFSSEIKVDVLRAFIEKGGAVLFLMSEGGDNKFHTNVNFFLEEYGMAVNPDSVVRTSFHKYSHPKEVSCFRTLTLRRRVQVYIANGVLNREITNAANRISTGSGPRRSIIVGQSAKDGKEQ